VRAEDGELGENRLIEILQNVAGRSELSLPELPRAILEEILHIFSYRQTDDMTLIVACGR
jgi:serine phosphatase RsbU (regulator of sigma subunit)